MFVPREDPRHLSGRQVRDTCLSFLMPDLEHVEAQPEAQQPAEPPSEAPPPTVLQPDVDAQ